MRNDEILSRFCAICGFLRLAREDMENDKLASAHRHIDEAEMWGKEFIEIMKRKLAKGGKHESTTKK